MLIGLIVAIFAFGAGMKVKKALILVKEARNVKYIEQVVRQVLDKDNTFKIVDFKMAKSEKQSDDKSDYLEFMRFKKLQEKIAQGEE